MAVRRRSRESWERLVSEAEHSSIAQTARRHGVKVETLKWWRWELRRQAAQHSPSLLPVVLSPAEPSISSPQSITIEVNEQVTMRVPVGSDEHYVAALIAAVRATC